MGCLPTEQRESIMTDRGGMDSVTGCSDADASVAVESVIPRKLSPNIADSTPASRLHYLHGGRC